MSAKIYVRDFTESEKTEIAAGLRSQGSFVLRRSQMLLFSDVLDLRGEIVLCELALENKDIDPKDLRDERILIKKAPPYLVDVVGASQTYVF